MHKAMKSAREWFDQKYPVCGQQSTYEDPLVLCREIREQAEVAAVALLLFMICKDEFEAFILLRDYVEYNGVVLNSGERA